MPETHRAFQIGGRFLFYLVITGVLLAIIDGTPKSVMDSAMRGVDGMCLRTIIQARLSAEADNKGQLPPEALLDGYVLAAYLARTGDEPDPKMWFSRLDPFRIRNGISEDVPRSILATEAASGLVVDSGFQRQPLAWAFALIPSISRLPSNTPVAWTRGLRPDGRWRADSLYPDQGGFVIFADGRTLKFFKRTIDGGFTKWGTNEPTGNVVEALPPGTRIGESTPGSGEAFYSGWRPWLYGAVNAILPMGSLGLLLLLCRIASRPPCSEGVRTGCALGSLACAFGFWVGLGTLMANLG